MNLALVYEKFVTGGGLENYVYGLAKGLRQAGYDLDIVTSLVDASTRDFPARFHMLPRRGRGANRLRLFAEESAALVGKLSPEISIGFGRTHTHDLHRAGGGCHQVYSRDLPFWKRWTGKNRMELALERQLYQGGGTKRFVVNSSLVAVQLYEEYGVTPDKITIIHTPVDQSLYQPATDRQAVREELEAELGLPSGGFAFLFVSLNHKRKGLDLLLQAWKDVPGELWIAGPDESRRYGHPDKVRWLGVNADLPKLYRAADWFLHPSRYDACANTVLQSLSSGLPGLISGRDGASEFIEEGRNGWILENPEDKTALRTGLERMIHTSYEEREAMGQNARESVAGLTMENHLRGWKEAIISLGINSQ